MLIITIKLKKEKKEAEKQGFLNWNDFMLQVYHIYSPFNFSLFFLFFVFFFAAVDPVLLSFHLDQTVFRNWFLDMKFSRWFWALSYFFSTDPHTHRMVFSCCNEKERRFSLFHNLSISFAFTSCTFPMQKLPNQHT